jgi:hypothetical protein
MKTTRVQNIAHKVKSRLEKNKISMQGNQNDTDNAKSPWKYYH